MNLLDRYLTRGFIFALVIFASSFMALYIVADFMFMMKDVRGKTPTISSLFDHYRVQTPLILYRLAPFLVLMSAVFVITRMSRLGELIPIRAAGISMFRTCAPLFVFAFLIGIGLTLVQELYVPGLAEQIRKTSAGKTLRPPLMKDRNGNRIVMEAYNIAGKMMRNVYLFRETPQGSEHIQAYQAVWEESRGIKGWRFTKGRLYQYDKKNRLVVVDSRALITDLPKEGKFIPSEIIPADIESTERAAVYLSINDLAEQHAKNPQQQHLRVEIHVRLAYPLTFLVLLLIGLPCVLIPETKNLFVGVGWCLLICLAYIIVFVFFTDLGNRGTLSPVVAAWMPLVVFFSIGFVLFDSIRT